ncbi:MAG: lytic transglycosylase domain-containing protein [Solirubrobacteraceae bacterium]
MSARTATASRGRSGSRSAASRRRVAARRRRSFVFIIAVLVVAGATVALLPLARKAVNEFGLPLQYQDVIRQQAAEKHLDPAFIAAVIYAETKFDARTSSAGAIGLMQILPQTAEFLARRSGAKTFQISDLNTPAVNIAYGSYYLRYLLNEYDGSKVEALAAYNGGETNVDGWVAAARARGQTLQISQIPFPETRAYVQRVLSAQQDYRHTYASQLGYG